MACDDGQWSLTRTLKYFLILTLICAEIDAKKSRENLTACQHLRRAESRRSKALTNSSNGVRIPRCTKQGDFEPVQCFSNQELCWCVDEYGAEMPGTRNNTRDTVHCSEPAHCSESNCRMFCASGFSRDARSGCSICKCRDPCDGIDCPNGQICQQQEVKCKSEPCPPVPTCKKARTLSNWCPVGLPLVISESNLPFLCGNEQGKPMCPPLYQCMVDSGNDYGVCCPNSMKFEKPGTCPNPDDTSFYTKRTGYLCGTPCDHDLECRHMEKCCFTKGCQKSCQQPVNSTTCHQAKLLAEVLSISEREGRGYVPDCTGPGGIFAPKQCSRNGLVCWCVDPRSGHKIKESMGAASMVNCEGWENMIARSLGRSLKVEQCDTNICAAICEYGFKNDHNECPTCECSEPCEGFTCPMNSHCEVATDPLCESGSALCTSWPVCKPNFVYSNPCEIGTPLTNNSTGEILYCLNDERQSRAFQPTLFSDEPESFKHGRAMSNRIVCPDKFKCMKLHGESNNVCCLLPEKFDQVAAAAAAAVDQQERQQSMCEYLRDFADRMEGTEEGMQLAIPPPKCTKDGGYEPRQCSLRKVQVTRKEQRKILEENTIRKMRMLLHSRERREAETLKLYRVDENALNIRVAGPITAGRSAKLISSTSLQQGIADLYETNVKKSAPAPRRPLGDEELIDIDVEECWCVDGFGTEIPQSRGFNVTDDSCAELRESLQCLELTCRMGCEYGFILDSYTKCPACQCRDPCNGVTCDGGRECRTVDVSCENEYCAPVPACLPRKAGQCPFLVPPGPDDNLQGNTCDYECRTDSHCDGSKRCCSNGCGTQCVQPQMKTTCQHLQAIQMHQASELGIPAKQIYIAQCDVTTGKFNNIQCEGDNVCWCVNDQGEEISGTRIKGKSPVCKLNSAFECPLSKCMPCENGFKTDKNGCRTCECRNFCDEISCSGDEECQLITVECIDSPCPKMPICIPKRDSVCPEGNPLKQGDLEIGCGPHNEDEICPTTHSCQLTPMSQKGVCCAKTRDVCFESLDTNCIGNSEHNSTKWRFSPRANKCVPIVVTNGDRNCQIKNLFHNQLACNSVCPVLTQCERLKLKNSLAAKRTDHSSVWFQPRCDPITGNWSPVQCLGKQPQLSSENHLQSIGRAIATPFDLDNNQSQQYGVCWCSDKKGAPLKGSLTRNLEPICNYRQARRRMHEEEGPNDPLMEELIKQMTMLVDVEHNEISQESMHPSSAPDDYLTSDNIIAVTEKLIELASPVISSKLQTESTKKLTVTTTRCRELIKTATFPVACDKHGAFLPTQCNGKQCWCVDAAGNQVSTDIFKIGSNKCTYTPIDSVAVELILENESGRSIVNLYDILKIELHRLIGDSVENLRVHENKDGRVVVRFELHEPGKIDTAFAIEETVKQGNLVLGYGQLHPDITMSRFIHRSQQILPVVLPATGSGESTLHTVVFILATSSAFLVSILVVYIMLKRGKRKSMPNYPDNRTLGKADKYVDFSSPIFVLNANENDNKIKSKLTDSERANI